MTAGLSVAQYIPMAGNLLHWALYLETRSETMIYQIVGSVGAFKYKHRGNVYPQKSSRFIALVFVSEIDSKDIKAVKSILESHPINTDVATSRNCQDWILEALEALHDEEYIDVSNFKERVFRNYN